MRALLKTPVNEVMIAQVTPLIEQIYALHEARYANECHPIL